MAECILKLNQLELRKTKGSSRDYYEIVEWNKDNKSCYSLATFDYNIKECEIDTVFIGGRPYETEYKDYFWFLLNYGYRYVTLMYDAKYYIENMNDN